MDDATVQQMYAHVMDKLASHEKSIDSIWEHFNKGSKTMYEIPEITNVFKPHTGGAGGYGMDGSGFGGNGGGLLAGLLFGALIGNRNGGWLGGAGGEGAASGVVNQIATTEVISKLGDIQGAIPLTAAQTQNAILSQSNQIAQGLTQLGNTVMNGNTQNLLATKDLSTQVAQGNAVILQAIAQNEAQALRDKLFALDASNRALGTEVNVTQNVNQMQQQAQQQAQLQGISSLLAGVVPLIYQRATNDQINIGSGTMSGNSASNANTAIR
jgi:hypothetical protein